MKKVFKKLFLIIIVALIFCFAKQNNVYGVGFVYQSWAADGGTLYFRTFTAPLPATVKAYLNDNDYTGNKITPSLGSFTYTYTEKGKTNTLKGTSFWVEANSENNYLHKNSSDINEAYTGFSTTAITFHKNQKTYGSGGDYKYSVLKSGYAVSNILNDIKVIYKSGLNNAKTTEKVKISGNIGDYYKLNENDSKATLYKMTLLEPSSGNNPVYVADRKLTSSQVQNIKNSGAVTIINGSKAVYVSQTLTYYSFNKEKQISALDPKDFMDSSPKERWGAGTKGNSGYKALGSALNLYDNILVFPTEVARKVTVQKVKLSDSGKATTVLNSTTRNTPSPKVGPEAVVNEATAYNSSDYKEGSEQYLGYNISYGTSYDAANLAMTDQVNAGSINNKATTCSLTDYTGKEDQHVIIEMYYTDQPKEEETITVIPRYITYDDGTGELVGTKTGTEEHLTAGEGKEVLYSQGNITDTYSGTYEILTDDSSIPDSYTLEGDGPTIYYNDYNGKKVVYINFKFTKSFSGTIFVRKIFYSASGSPQWIENTTTEITGSSGTQNISLNDYDYNGYTYVGYIALYDKKMPSCYAAVEKPSYNLDKSKYRTGICINFMFQETIKEKTLGQPTRTSDGLLSIKGLGISGLGTNNGSKINSDTLNIKQTSILSIPSGEEIAFGMTKLQKYYIAGLRVEPEIYFSKKNPTHDERRHLKLEVMHITLIPLVDVNQNLVVRLTPYFDSYTFIIPYKYMKYTIKNSATYALKKSDIYYPDGAGSNNTLGDKLFDSAVSKIINYNLTNNVTYGIDETAGNVDKIYMASIDAKPAFKSGLTGVTDNFPTDVIYTIDQETGEMGDDFGVQSSRIIPFSMDWGSNIISGLTSNINLGDSVSLNAFSQIADGISALGIVPNAVIMEIVPSYTNISTAKNDLWEAIKAFTNCGASKVVQVIGILFGQSWNIDTVINCDDVPAGVIKFINFWKSLRKTSVFVYEATKKDGTPGYYVQNLKGSYAPSIMARRKLDSIRNVEKTFTLATSEKNVKLYYSLNGNKETIATTNTFVGSLAQIFSDIVATIGNKILDLILGELSGDVSISQKRISDLNCTKDSEEIRDWDRFWDNIFGSIETFHKQDTYAFEGYVCVYDASSGMVVNSTGLDAYKKGFGGTIANNIDELIDNSTQSNILFGSEKVSLKELNGIRAFAEQTKYEDAANSNFKDNIFWSNLNIIGDRKIFNYNATNNLNFKHNVYNKKVEAVNVYTPVEIDLTGPVVDDHDIVSQIIDDISTLNILDNKKFTFYVSPGKYEDSSVYNNIESGTSKEKLIDYGLTTTIRKFITAYEISLSFKANKIKIGSMPDKTNVNAYTKITIPNTDDNYSYWDTAGDYRIKVSVEAEGDLVGKESYTARAITKNIAGGLANYKESSVYKDSNTYTYDEFLKIRGNICNVLSGNIDDIDAPVYYDEKLVEISSEKVDRLYDFRVTDVKDIDWKDIFRGKDSSIHNGDAYYIGLRGYDLLEGLVKRTTSEVGKELNRTLPIGPYKSTDSTYMKAPKLGYRISFDVKLSGAYDAGKTYGASYSTPAPESDTSLRGQTLRNVIIKPKFYYISKNGKTYKPSSAIDLYYKNDSGKYIGIENYALTYTPKDGNRLLDSEDLTTNLSTKVEYLNNISANPSHYDGLSPLCIILTPSAMTTGSTNDDYQTYYGEYKLPNSTIVVNSGDTPSEANRLKDGYVGIVFEITSGYEKDGIYYTLNYSQNMDRETTATANSSEWEYEGYLKQQYNKPFTSAKIQLEKGVWNITTDADYENIKGTVVLFDLDARASTDFE